MLLIPFYPWYSYWEAQLMLTREALIIDPQLFAVLRLSTVVSRYSELPTMHRSNTAQVHQKVHTMGNAALDQPERPSVVGLRSVRLPELGHSPCPATLDFELHPCIGSDVGSSPDSKSGNLYATELVVINQGVSGITEQTRATTVDGDDDFDAAHSHDPMLGCDKQDQDIHNFPPRDNPYEGPVANIYPVIHFSEETFDDGVVADMPPGFTGAGTGRDQHPHKLENTVGPDRYYHQLGISDGTPGPKTEEAGDTRPSKEPVNALWRHPEESNFEVRKAIHEVERLELLPHSTFSIHPQGIITPPYNTKPASGTFMAATGELVPAIHFGTAGEKPPLMEADWGTSLSSSDAARKARMNETEGMILRMMPRSRELHFDLDREGFWNAGFHRDTTDRIEHAARMVVGEFEKHDLGITFAYTPGPGSKVFRICYDPSIVGDTLALAFFPSDPRERWQVRISYMAAVSWAYGGRLEYMHNILAHEFMHILGFRHWNAGFDLDEMQLPSVHLPGTTDRDRKSVMYTSVHGKLWFNKEDYRAIRRVYKASIGDTVGGCLIVDVDPYV